MRTLPLLALTAVFFVSSQATAHAQVTTSDQSLQALKPRPGPAATRPSKATPEKAHPRARRSPHVHATPAPAQPKPHVQKLPEVPPAPPAHPVIAPPPLVMPTHPPPPLPPVPVSDTAQGAATPLPDGTRITFGPQKFDLNPTTLAAIKAIAAEALANPAMTVGVTGWAPGVADDPSTPRRLSLDRALAARAVLINAGIASERIRTIAKGMIDIGSAPADRVDVVRILPPAVKH